MTDREFIDDAQRYRWLRAEHERVDPVCHLLWKQNSDRSSSEWVSTVDFDAAIDREMSRERALRTLPPLSDEMGEEL